MTTDVNQQLYNTRTAAWDRYEYTGKDGLDTTTGQAALYTSTPAWHGLGNVIPGGTSSIDQVLTLGGIDYEVEKRLVRYSFGDELRTMPDRWVTVRTDSGDPLGVVGSKYEVIQNREIFEFLEDLVANNDVIWESAGALRGGRRVFVTMRLPENVVVDPGGLDDEIVPFIVAVNSHDGSSQAYTGTTPWRIVCANTERWASRDALSRWGIRHTRNALSRIEEARRTLGLTVAYYDVFAEEETLLARTDLEIAQFHDLIADLWPLEADANDRTRGIAERRTERLDAMFRAEAERAGRTAYAGERTVTDWLDHVAPRRPGKTMTEEIARATAIVEGTDDDLKTKTHKRLMLLTRR